MKTIKIIYAGLFIFFISAGLFFFKLKSQEKVRQKAVLAGEMWKVQSNLMLDLRQAHENSIRGVPPDGLWHRRIGFSSARQGTLEYMVSQGSLFRIQKGKPLLVSDHIEDLLIRRQKATPDMLEVQVVARKNVTLTSNLKIRIQQ
jgi:hypothetical protein